MKAYCEYPTYLGEQIAVTGIEAHQLSSISSEAVWGKHEDSYHAIRRGIRKNDVIIHQGKNLDPCHMCTNRLVELTQGCKTCRFQCTKPEILEKNPEELFEKTMAYLKNEQFEKLKIRHVAPGQEFNRYINEDDLVFDEETIAEQRQILADRAKNAVESKKYKKEKCTLCVYSDPDTYACKATKPSFCRQKNSLFQTEREMKEKALSYIQDSEQLLLLSTLCGRIFKMENRRYRLSFVQDELLRTFRATLDYAPWTQIDVTWEELRNAMPGVEYIFENSDVLEMEKEKQEEMAALYILLRVNWNHIYSIKRYQKQHMFWASYNGFEKRMDIEIHLSKNTYPYYFESIKELASTTTTIMI